MKYGIWRHDNALGNSAEHTYGLAKHLKRIGDNDPTVYVEKEFQADFAMCIPGMSRHRIKYFEPGVYKAIMRKTIASDPRFSDIHMPNVYDVPGMKKYPASWADLSKGPDCALEFPSTHRSRHLWPTKSPGNIKNAIVIQVREANTVWKRLRGSLEPWRSVDPRVFFDVARYLADRGHMVVRIGDRKQTPFPEHRNIIDFALMEGRTMMDDLYLLWNCKAFISCDSGVWPMAAAMKRKLILTNVTSVFDPNRHGRWIKPEIIACIDASNTQVLFKPCYGRKYVDNSFEDIINATEDLMGVE